MEWVPDGPQPHLQARECPRPAAHPRPLSGPSLEQPVWLRLEASTQN